ncbi:MAG: Dabb family protein [Duncaniella sp.]|nr:Dabb family protein [Duncaniella sp.]
MVNHVVTFRLQGDRTKCLEAAEAFRDALLKLPSQIDVLESIEVGINANPSEEWDVVLIARLPDMESVAVYAKHPAHVAAASVIAPFKADRACVDYYC